MQQALHVFIRPLLSKPILEEVGAKETKKSEWFKKKSGRVHGQNKKTFNWSALWDYLGTDDGIS